MASPPVLPPLPLSSSWFNSTPPESAPNRGGALTGSKKFGTVSGPLSSERRHRGGLGFFSPDAPGDENERPAVAQIDEELKDLAGLGRGAEDGWSISVAEHHASRTKTRGKKSDPVLTVYVSTPTSSLTLSRSYQSILDFDARLRSQLPGRLPAGLPSLATVPNKRANVLATLSRTLSPRRPPRSNSVGGGGSATARPTHAVDVAQVGAYFTRLAADPTIRSQTTWKSFFASRPDDLESVRVERRIKRVRSDVGTVTNHLSMVPLSATGLENGITGSGLEDEFTRSLSASRKEPSGGSTTESSDSDGAVDTSAAQRVDLVPSSHAAVVKLGIVSELGLDGKRREASAATDVTDLTESSDAGHFELPARPQSADPEGDAGSRSSRHIEMPTSDSKSSLKPVKRSAPALSIDSFDIMRVLGKGCAGKVLLVRQRTNGSLYALKAIHKHHVLAHRELDHTRTEQIVLKRCSRDQSNPFVVRLHYSFHDKETLYLALDFHPGGDLATQLARWGRLGRDRTRFYTAEIVEGVEGLHRAGVIYRDLKPENILISEAGHIVLTDFGLSKDFGHASIPPSTAEGRVESAEGGPSPNGAPPSPRPHWLSSSVPSSRSVSTPPSAWVSGRREVLLGEPYSYEVDSWSLGTMLYEMLAGVTPFWSEDHSTMYRRVLHEELAFDEESRVFDDDTKSLLRGLLQRNPLLRMTDARIKRHPYFSMIEWPHVFYKRYVPPFIPSLDPLDPADTSQFDDTYTSQMPRVSNEDGTGAPGDEREVPEGEPQAAFDEAGHDVFDGYSYFGGRDADSIVGPDPDDDDEVPIAVTPSPSELPDAFLDDADLDADNSGLADQTFSSMASISTPGTSIVHLSPEQPRRRQRSEGLDSLVEAPSSAENDMMVEEPDADDGDGEQSEEDDWDVIDANVGGEARNGGKGTTLWAKGVKDRYRLLLSSTPRGPSPLRPTAPHSNGGGSRKESSGSARSSVTPSPSLLPAPRRSLRRLASVRSSNSSKGALKTSRSQRSLRVESEKLKRSASSSGADTPRKAGQAMKRLASAFRIP